MNRFICLLLLSGLLLVQSLSLCQAAPREATFKFNTGRIKLLRATHVSAFNLPSFFVSEFVVKMRETLNKENWAANEALILRQYPHASIVFDFFRLLTDPGAAKKVEGIGVYQLGLDDKDGFHTAWVITVKDNEKLDKALGDTLNGKLTEEKAADFKLLHQSWEDKVKGLFAETAALPNGVHTIKMTELFAALLADQGLEKPALEKLEFTGPEFFQIKKQTAAASGVRLVYSQYGSQAAFYAKAYAFNANDRAAVLMLFTTDADKEFWTNMFDRAIMGRKI